MKSTSCLALLAATTAYAHYIFSRVIVNGVAKGGDYTYIRQNSNTYMPSFPSEVINSPDLRCNKGAKPGGIQTLTVKAGDKVGFKLWNNEFIEHPGPGFVYIWCSWQKDRLEFAIPVQITADEYLVRVEHISLNEAFKDRAQFYTECAQSKIESSGTGTPAPMAKILGIYKADDPGIKFDK
ncbi:glycoside hydrolase family 61 protein [Xylariaceae sp. FL1651]|nr:glycoside hydrolase family 61 protein [Xylariaceae sp. FL1651]